MYRGASESDLFGNIALYKYVYWLIDWLIDLIKVMEDFVKQ